MQWGTLVVAPWAASLQAGHSPGARMLAGGNMNRLQGLARALLLLGLGSGIWHCNEPSPAPMAGSFAAASGFPPSGVTASAVSGFDFSTTGGATTGGPPVAWCVPKIGDPAYPWVGCENAEVLESQILSLDVSGAALLGTGGSANVDGLAGGGGQPSEIQGGAAGDAASEPTGQAGAGTVSVPHPGVAFASAPLCAQSPGGFNYVSVMLVALDTPVRGLLSLDTTSKLCGAVPAQQPGTEVTLDAQSAATVCLQTTYQGDYWLLRFDNLAESPARLAVTGIQLGCQ